MNTRSSKTLWLAQTSILAAILIIMALTPLGYLKIGLVALTLLTIPVVVGAIVVGPLSGATLGLVFGLTSFYQCFGADPFGAFLLSNNPILTFLLCVIPRVLTGLLVGLLFRAFAKHGKTGVIVYSLTSLSGSVLNTLLFVGTLILLFGSLEYSGGSITKTAIGLLALNAPIEVIVCTVIGTAIAKALDAVRRKRLASGKQE